MWGRPRGPRRAPWPGSAGRSITKALAAFARDWSDVCDLALHPVVEDPDLAEVLKGMGKRK